MIEALLAALVGITSFLVGFVLANWHRDYTSDWWTDWNK